MNGMDAKTLSVLDAGFEGLLIEIECHMSNGLPNIVVVGFANKAVDESKERIRSAFATSGLMLPKKRITINLAPADIPKESTSLDLGIAATILKAGSLVRSLPTDVVIIGELGLDGAVKPVRGIIGKLLTAKNNGNTSIILPEANLSQANLVEGVNLYPVKTLKELYELLLVPLSKPQSTKISYKKIPQNNNQTSFKDIVGQPFAKRALEIAAAGNHNVLLSGPPGTGKSMLAKALISILPDPTVDEMIQITHLHSLSSNNFDDVITARPFRSPHHSSSDTSIIGGGRNPKPGEISLAHRGVLLFDEFPEYRRSALEGLRQPLEDSAITVARAKGTVTYPADFLFVATANPCPCGFYGSTKVCKCLPTQIMKYQKKMSGPIIDRIDIFAEVNQTPHARLLDTSNEENSSAIRSRVANARLKQQRRFRSSRTNSTMSNKDIKKHAVLDASAKTMLDTAAERMHLSSRGYMRTIKIARTIADLDNSDNISTKHLAEALQYRKKPLANP